MNNELNRQNLGNSGVQSNTGNVVPNEMPMPNMTVEMPHSNNESQNPIMQPQMQNVESVILNQVPVMSANVVNQNMNLMENNIIQNEPEMEKASNVMPSSNIIQNQMVEPVNLMSDFSEVIANTPQIVTQVEEAQNLQVETAAETDQNEIVVPVAENTVNGTIPSSVETPLTANNVSAEMVTNTEESISTEKKKKKNNWVFILALFAIVAIFVLLLPLFVKIFGYN